MQSILVEDQAGFGAIGRKRTIGVLTARIFFISRNDTLTLLIDDCTLIELYIDTRWFGIDTFLWRLSIKSK